MAFKTAEKKKRSQARSFHSVNWKDDNDVVDFVMSRWETRQHRFQPLERQWFINIAQYLGHQWMVYDDSRETLVQPAAPPWRVRLTANLLQGISRKIVSKILRQKPTWSVVPATAETEDIMSARIAEKVLRYYWGGPLDMDTKLVDLFTWMTTCGNAFLRIMWDPRKGNEVSIEKDSVKDQQLKEKLTKLFKKDKNPSVNLGDLDVEVVTPFEVDPDPSAVRFELSSHVIHTKARGIDWVKDRYGDAAKDLEPDANDGLVRHFQRRIAEFGGPNGFGGTGGADEEDNQGQILVHELWTKPIKGRQRGLYVVVAGETLLARQSNEWQFAGQSCLPYVHFQEIPVPGRLWGTCALEQAIPIQADYNRARSQLIENRNLMTRPKWLVPKGAHIGDMALTSEPGEVVEHTPGLEPKAWVPPPLPPYVIRSIEADRTDIQDVTQIHDVTQGKAPGQGVRSGVAIAALQEQDDTVLSPSMILTSRALEIIGSMALEAVSRKVREPRLIKIVGKNNLIEAETFLGNDIVGSNGGKPGVNYFDVRVQMGSQLPLSKQAKAQFIGELVQTGILNPEQDRQQILEMLEMGSDEPLYDENRLDLDNARNENRILMKGDEMLDAQEWDDHEQHIIVHRLFQKTPEFVQKIANDPRVLENFAEHINQHMQAIQPAQAPQPIQEPAPAPLGNEVPIDIPVQPAPVGEVAPGGAGTPEDLLQLLALARTEEALNATQ